MKNNTAKTMELLGVKRSLDNGNDWRGIIEGRPVWIGSPSGSRTGQFDFQVTMGKVAVMGKARTWPALVKGIAAALYRHDLV